MYKTDLQKPTGVLVKTTLVDYPDIVACSFFLRGCNLHCPYCYNISLVKNNEKDIEFSSLEDLFKHLEKRQGLLEGLVISGGEPLMNPLTKIIIKKAKSLNYKIKIDTNGLFPTLLEQLLNNEELKPDFIAMDVKTSPNRYITELFSNKNILSNIEEILKKSIDLISTLPTKYREFRTVLVPNIVKKDDIKNIASLLPKDAAWKFASFQNKNCLDPNYNNLLPYTESEKNELVEFASQFIANSKLR